MAPNLKIKEITMGMKQSVPIPNQNIGKCPEGQRANSCNDARHINGNSYLVNLRRILKIPRVSTPYATNGTQWHGVREMCYTQRKIETMVKKIQRVSPAIFLYNMVKIFANTNNTLTPSLLRTPCAAAQHENTGFCGWGVFHPKTKSKRTYASQSSN